MKGKGLHIGLCGIDGSGKSSQIRLLHKWMKERSFDVVLYEDTRNFVSEVSTSIALRHSRTTWGFEYFGIDRYTMAMNFEILRQTMYNVLPYTRTGIMVLTPRTVFDHLARTKARGCNNETYKISEEIVFFQGVPDVTIWLDIPPELAYHRIQARGYDFSELEFLEKFRAAFAEFSASHNLVRVDGCGSLSETHNKILQIVLPILEPSHE